jgi:ferredoxin
MELRFLKRIRVGISLVLLVLSGFLFVDLGGWLPPQWTTAVTAFQLIPALVKTVTMVGLWTVGLFVLVLLTLLFGRVYCSSICPLGTFQDIIIRLVQRWKKKHHRRRWYDYDPPPYRIHYVLLALTALSAAGGVFALLNLLEPFSNFGRIVGVLARPLVVVANNGLAAVAEALHSYGVYRIPLHGAGPEVLVGSLIFLGVLVYLTVKDGRLFCNLLCPAGALLSLLSRFSLFRIVIDKSTCTDCGLCEKVCKAKCIDSETKKVDFPACVSCFNCLDACPTVGLKYEGVLQRFTRRPAKPAQQGRRQFLAMAAIPVVLAGEVKTDTLTVGKSRSKSAVTPPGSLGVDRFSSLCTACHLCVSVCPTQVIRPALLEYGVAGIFQPRMDYRVNYCTYECLLCTSVCPTGAIRPLPLEEKKLAQIGKVQFIKDDCVVVAKKKDCGACAEHCPTKAVTMVPYEGALRIPQTNNEVCIGCGACEHACPTLPNKAIYVESNVIHQVAKKPEIKKLEEPVNTGADFPF